MAFRIAARDHPIDILFWPSQNIVAAVNNPCAFWIANTFMQSAVMQCMLAGRDPHLDLAAHHLLALANVSLQGFFQWPVVLDIT